MRRKEERKRLIKRKGTKRGTVIIKILCKMRRKEERKTLIKRKGTKREKRKEQGGSARKA